MNVIAGLKTETHDIYEGDVFKHLFIWAVLMDRRNLAMLFWKKENNDYICKFLFDDKRYELYSIVQCNCTVL